MQKKIFLGTSDFKKIIEQDYLYVDKTLFIKELVDAQNTIFSISRPRHFGKTLNLSMLYYFFSNTEKAKHLFKNTTLDQHPESMEHQGTYPVISMTFKGMKVGTWVQAQKSITEIISEEFKKFRNVLFTSLSQEEKKYYSEITSQRVLFSTLITSLQKLTLFLERYYQKKVIILIDEYNIPLHAAHKYGYYEEMLHFIQSFFSNTFQNNESIYKAVMTDILPSTNNAYTLIDNYFSDSFGFTEQEVDELLTSFNMQNKKNEIADWYGGYQFSNTKIYNPWSVLSYIHNKNNPLISYWADTSDSDNACARELFLKASGKTQKKLLSLLNGVLPSQIIKKENIFQELDKESNDSALWSFLLFSGYVAVQNKKYEISSDALIYDLIIPNNEIHLLYESFLEKSFIRILKGSEGINELLSVLKQGDDTTFEEIIKKCVINSINFLGISKNDKEAGCYLFFLGMLVTFQKRYEITLDQESHFEKNIIQLVPKENEFCGFIVEFKKAHSREELLKISITKTISQLQK